MENEAKNNDVLGDLYALRAGLSVISQNADELKQVQQEELGEKSKAIKERQWQVGIRYSIYGDKIGDWVSNRCKYNDSAYGNIDKIIELKKKYGCKDDINLIDDMISDGDIGEDDDIDNKKFTRIQKKQLELGEEVFCEWLKTQDAEKFFMEKVKTYKDSVVEKRRESNQYNKIILIFSILLVLGVIAVLSGIFLSTLIPILLGVVFAIIGLVVMVISIISQRKVKHLSDKIIDEMKAYDKNIQFLFECRDIFAHCEKKYSPIESGYKYKADVMYLSLQKQFNKLLDDRDWKHLDLIIYYFETGRADSIKEALQLLEREIQTKRIIGAIQEATQCICSSIERAANRISEQLGVISSQLSQIATQQQMQIAQNNILISQAQMQNALIAKANVTSEQLMNDIKYIKEYGVELK